MKNVILIAPPAAGKGTLSKYLTDTFGYVQLSTGDMLRERAEEDTKLKEIMKTGKLIDDKTVFEALEAKLNKLGDTPYILDGFPRTVTQAVMYDELLQNMGKDLGVVIYLDVDKEELKKRVVTRLVCPKCRASYSTRNESLLPKKEGLCDNCRLELIQREDDTEEVFDKRYNEYLEKTSPLIDYYESKGLLVRISSSDANEIFKEASSLVRNA